MILELIESGRSGWFSGKGFKAARHKNHEEAIEFFKLALKHSTSEYDPVLYDSMAFSYYNLGNLSEAFVCAERSIKEYLELKDPEKENPDTDRRIGALQELVIRIKSKNTHTTKR